MYDFWVFADLFSFELFFVIQLQISKMEQSSGSETSSLVKRSWLGLKAFRSRLKFPLLFSIGVTASRRSECASRAPEGMGRIEVYDIKPSGF